MGFMKEIERKYLVDEDKLPELPEGARMVQGYLSFNPTVRVRTEEGPGATRKAYITIKGSGMLGRDEYEYDVPFEEAGQMLKLAHASLVSKTRYRLPLKDHPGLKWEIDLFEGANAGLVVAELEIPDENYQFPEPEWLGKEVTEDPAYKNALLAQHPFKDW
jgi:CYTH domain-containing protein